MHLLLDLLQSEMKLHDWNKPLAYYYAAEELLCIKKRIYIIWRGSEIFFLPASAFYSHRSTWSRSSFFSSQARTHVLFKHLFHDHHYSTKEACYEPLREKIANNAMYTGTSTSWHVVFVSPIILLHHKSRLRTTSKGRLFQNRLEDAEKFGRRV